MKGILLAGGSGTRLYPATLGLCKQLLPIYDKPMVYYPLSTLMLAGIRDILIVSTPDDTPRFEKIFGDGSHLGLSRAYAVQAEPRGLAEALIIGEAFVGDDAVCLILGDNIFFGHGLTEMLRQSRKTVESEGGATIFAYYVKDPQRYGVIEFDDTRRALSIEEKPRAPKSNYAVTGLYFYDNRAIGIAKAVKPSGRGELEITDVNKAYLQAGRLKVNLLGRGFAWLDTGTHESMLEAGEFIAIVEKRQGYKIGCIEEIAYRMGYVTKEQFIGLASPLMKSGYGEYLKRIASDRAGADNAL